MTRPGRPRRPGARRAGAVCGSAVLAVVLAGCGGSVVRSGAAAVVGEERITIEELASLVDRGLSDPAASQLAGDREAFQRQLLAQLVQAELVEEAARRKGVSITAGQADQAYAGIVQQAGGQDVLRQQAAAAGLSLDQVRGIARTQALLTALTQRVVRDGGGDLSQEQAGQALEQELRRVADDLDISINPRFGRWDRQSLGVEERGPQRGRELSSPSPASDALDPDLPVDPQQPQQQPEQPPEQPQPQEQEPEVLPSPTA